MLFLKTNFLKVEVLCPSCFKKTVLMLRLKDTSFYN